MRRKKRDWVVIGLFSFAIFSVGVGLIVGAVREANGIAEPPCVERCLPRAAKRIDGACFCAVENGWIRADAEEHP